jgi:hypothetical protein
LGAALKIMIDHNVWGHHLAQGLARVSLLTAPGLARRLAQAHGLLGLLQPVARRRLAAVAAVEPEPAFQLGDSILQALNQLLLGSGCVSSGFVVLLLMASSPVRRFNAG